LTIRCERRELDQADVNLLTQALAREAQLLDGHQYEDWLRLLAPDIRYVVPVPEWVRRRSGNDERSDEDLAFTYLDETYESLRLRVARLQTGLAHAEMPPSMLARVISVPLIEPFEAPPSDTRSYSVVTSFTLHQTRHEDRVDLFAGRRDDLWTIPAEPRRSPQLCARTVHLIQRVLPRTFTTFF
jgi:3-phenylpropionate/cinnamic acid dioxygenase small subunit